MAGAFGAELGTAAATTNVATTTITIGATGASVGDLVVVGSAWGSGSQTATFADSKGNTWTAGTPQQNSTAGSSQVWWSVLTAALVAADTLTVTRSGTSRGTLQALKFTGPSGTSATVLDQQAGAKLAPAGSTAPSSGATATTAGADIVVGFVGFATVAGTVTPGSGYTSAPTSTVQTNNGFEHAMEYKIASGAAAETASFTLPLTAGWGCIVAAFNVAGGGTTQVSTTRRVVYGVQAQVAAARRVNYGVQASVATTRRVAYNVVAAVLATRRIRYDVQAQVAATRRVNYDVAASTSQVTAPRRVVYSVSAQVSTARRVVYDVMRAVAATRAINYDVVASALATRRVAYSVAGNVNAARHIIYTVDGLAGPPVVAHVRVHIGTRAPQVQTITVRL